MCSVYTHTLHKPHTYIHTYIARIVGYIYIHTHMNILYTVYTYRMHTVYTHILHTYAHTYRTHTYIYPLPEIYDDHSDIVSGPG